MDYKNILVTGGAGFIGSNFVHYWLAKHPNDNILVLDALTYAGNINNLELIKSNNKFKFIEGNICDTELIITLLKEFHINVIVNFAAESHVDRSITDPDGFIETNILGTYSLLKAAKAVWIDEPTVQGSQPISHRFHHVSTDEVYGTLSKDDPAFTEKTPYAPNSPYSASKAASDHLVRAYHHTYGLAVTTSNCSNNYGPFHFPEKLIPLIITNILNNNELPIYGDGLQIRDWLYVEDHAYGIDLVLNKGVVGENYNIGGHNEWANIDIVKLICSLMNQYFSNNNVPGLDAIDLKQKYPNAVAAIAGNAESLIKFVTDRAGHDRRYAIDATKTKHELGYSPRESFETGIKKTLEWYLINDNWWKSL